MIAIWFVRGDVKVEGQSKKFRGMVTTKSATLLPDVSAAIKDHGSLEAIRSVTLLCDFEGESLDFMVDQTGR